MNRAKYYAALGKHTQEQVDGQEAILNEAARRAAGHSAVSIDRESVV